jgi:hypothetical protein
MKAPKIFVVVGRKHELLAWSFDNGEAEKFREAIVAKWQDEHAATVDECPPVGTVDVPCSQDERERLTAEITAVNRALNTERSMHLRAHAALCERNSEINVIKREQATLVKALGAREP